MADKTIKELPLIHNVNGSERIPVSAGGVLPLAVSVSQLDQFIQGAYILVNADIGAHRIVTVLGGYADCTNPDHGESIAGITVQSVSAGSEVPIKRMGEMTESSWNFIPGKPVYLGQMGLLTQTPPDSGIIVEIGRAITSTRLLIDIQQTLYLA